MKAPKQHLLSTLMVIATCACNQLEPVIFAQVPANSNRIDRVAWTTSKFVGSPDPPPPYRAEHVYPTVSFDQPTVITSAPGTDRLFVVQRDGKIYSFATDSPETKAELLIDLAERLEKTINPGGEIKGFGSAYGLTFHPEFPAQPYCYVCYVVKSQSQLEHGTRVSRFRITESDPPRAEPMSEEIMITWLEGGHNGGCLKFGPHDGYLYISTGDGGFAFPPDGRNSGQDVTNLLSAILRIDVERPDGSRKYSIPADNPFVDYPGARPEIWAYGFRNPWKMSFDRQNGDLWVGDVGWELWELVFRVQRGGNYGWSIMEGRQPVHMERTRGPTPILPPTLDIPHIDGASITGGFVYRGRQLQDLVGSYVFGDWETRRIWSARLEGDRLVDRQDLTEPTVRLVGFAEDHDGELYLLDHDTGTIHQLVPNPTRESTAGFPRSLSATGIFSDVSRHQFSRGVIPFSINARQWSDHATAERFLGVPGQEPILVRSKPTKIPGSMFSRQMDFPTGTVLGKTLTLPMALPSGQASSDSLQEDASSSRPETGWLERRIETQILHFDGTAWRGYTYAWNNEQTDAILVERAGLDRTIDVFDHQGGGGVRQQRWHYPSRSECGRCHNPWAEYTLAFNLAQLNRPSGSSSGDANQLEQLTHIGLLQWSDDWRQTGKRSRNALPTTSIPADLPQLVEPYHTEADLDARARSYLHVNCAHCHRFNGGGVAYFELLHDLPLEKTEAVGVRPTQGTFGIHQAQIIAPGEPDRSILIYRLAKLGRGRMPYLGSDLVDDQGLQLMHDWIEQLPVTQTATETPQRSDAADSGTLHRTTRFGLNSTSDAMRTLFALIREELPGDERRRALAAGTSHSDVQIRDLFERFLPPEKRSRRLGAVIRPQQILALQGDAQRGRTLFHRSSGVQCKSCHKIAEQGESMGPDLTEIGKKYTRRQILESILEPSKNIDPKYTSYLVETTDGRVMTGLLVNRTDERIILKDAKLNEIRIPSAEVEQVVAQRQSLMPELLLRDLTAQQVADLLAYLHEPF